MIRIVIASQQWSLSVTEIADDYDLSEEVVKEALAFYQNRTQEIDELINSETALESIYQ